MRDMHEGVSGSRQLLLIVSLAVLIAGCGPGLPSPPTTSTTAPVGTTPTSALTTPTSTAPTHTTTTVHEAVGALMVLGDWGAGSDAQADVAAAMAELAQTVDVQAILTTGDNFYIDDETRLMEPFAWATDAGIAFWIAWGNHDVESSERIDDINTVFENPPPWTVREWGYVDVVILDSNRVGDPDQLRFLEDRLAASEDPTMIVSHHPALSCGPHGDTAAILSQWVPRFDDDVVLVLAGHDHNYQRFVSEGVTYVVSGGGGQRLYDIKTCPRSHAPLITGASEFHFLLLEQLDGQITVSAYRTDLSVIEKAGP